MSKCSHNFFVNYNINDVLSRQQNKPMNPTATVPKKEILLLLPYLGLQSKIITQQLLACINKFYECIDLRVIFQNTHRSLFSPTKTGSTVLKCPKLYIKLVVGTVRISTGAPNGNFRENISSEDDLRTRIFGTFVVKFLACLPLLGFSNI